MKNLSGRIAIVTGASKGIGAEVAIKLADLGAKVVVNFSGSKDAADAVVREIKENGGEAIAIQADVSKTADVKRIFSAALEYFGRIDILINNAGIMITKTIEATTDDDFERQFNINVKGVFNTMREAATHLSDNGSIVNFSTSVNRIILPGYATYVATKAAVEQLTRVFSKEIGHRGINVNTVSPGPTNTELFTTGKSTDVINRLASLSAFNRIGETKDIAGVVAFLVSDDAKWISAQNIGVNGGMA